MAIQTPISLADLPVEILQQVCSNFCRHCRGEQPSLSPGVGTLHQRYFSQQSTDEHVDIVAKQTLVSLCLTSKGIKRTVQPVLYHEFSLGFGNGYALNHTWHGRFRSFVHTIAARRDLADLVRAVYLPGALLKAVLVDEAREILLEAAGIIDIDHSDTGQGRYKDDLAMEKRSRERDFASFLASYLDDKGNLTEEYQTNPMWAFPVPTYDRRQPLTAEFACLLMTLLPNVQSMGIERGCNLPNFGFSQSQLQAISTTDGNFTTMPEMELSTGLQLLSICGVQADKMKQLPNMPNLKSLHLVAMYMREQELRNVLDRCTGKLHTFVYEACRRPSYLLFAPHDYHFFPSDVGNCLANHRKSLRAFHLDLRLNWYSNQLSNTDPRLSLNLRQFTSLETALLSSDLLFKTKFGAALGPIDEDCQYIEENEIKPLVECLPRNIVSLHLIHHEGVVPPYTKRALMDLADTKCQQLHQFPNLGSVTVTWDIAHRFTDGTVAKKLEACGVKLEFKTWLASMTSGETW